MEKVRPTLSNPYHRRPLPSSRLEWFSDFVHARSLAHFCTTENYCTRVYLFTCLLVYITAVVPI